MKIISVNSALTEDDRRIAFHVDCPINSAAVCRTRVRGFRVENSGPFLIVSGEEAITPEVLKRVTEQYDQAEAGVLAEDAARDARRRAVLDAVAASVGLPLAMPASQPAAGGG